MSHAGDEYLVQGVREAVAALETARRQRVQQYVDAVLERGRPGSANKDEYYRSRDEIFNGLLAAGIAMGNAQLGQVHLKDRDSDKLVLRTSIGFESPGITLPKEFSGDFRHQVLERGQSLFIADISRLPSGEDTSGLAHGASGVRSLHAVPIFGENDFKGGVLTVFYLNPHFATHDETSSMRILAGHITQFHLEDSYGMKLAKE